MNRALWTAAALLALSMTAARLVNRWREEKADRTVTLLVDWQEVRDGAVRQDISDPMLLARLRNAGADALLVGSSTLQDYLQQDFIFSSRAAAEAILGQLLDRSVAGIALKREGGKYTLVRSSKYWDRLKDFETGFNAEFLGQARQAGFHLALRVNHDPWLAREKLFSDLQKIGSANQDLGILLNTDEVPGGPEALASWVSFLESHNYAQLLFEFRPTKSSMKLARRLPQSVYRAHTIGPNELRDLSPDQERARWRRAVEERSCRFLLLHMSPNDSLDGYLETIAAVRRDLLRQGFRIGWPRPRPTWSLPSYVERRLLPLLALLMAILLPGCVLRVSLRGNPWMSYGQIFFLTMAGACVVAAVAENALTRIQVVPFRGVKLAFALGWLGSFLSLYSWNEVQEQLSKMVRRSDVVLGLAIAAVIGYMWIRMGNAGAGWKVGWEQGLRDRMEDLLIARPRFKEFAIGYPLLLFGLLMRPAKASRLLIGIGMIGPLSMINTFCHLHSPLYLAFWRSVNGFLIGGVLGFFLWLAFRKLREVRFAP